MPVSAGKPALKQSGFYFPPGPVFEDREHRIYLAMFGDVGDKDTTEIRTTARESMVALFEAVMQNVELFRTMRGGPLAWYASSTLGIGYSSVCLG